MKFIKDLIDYQRAHCVDGFHFHGEQVWWMPDEIGICGVNIDKNDVVTIYVYERWPFVDEDDNPHVEELTHVYYNCELS